MQAGVQVAYPTVAPVWVVRTRNSGPPLAGRSECRGFNDVEGPAEQWALLRRRLNSQPQRRDQAPVRAMIRAYEVATGTGVYCD